MATQALAATHLEVNIFAAFSRLSDQSLLSNGCGAPASSHSDQVIGISGDGISGDRGYSGDMGSCRR